MAEELSPLIIALREAFAEAVSRLTPDVELAPQYRPAPVAQLNEDGS